MIRDTDLRVLGRVSVSSVAPEGSTLIAGVLHRGVPRGETAG